ncbi:MAG: 30S ribosomal protein S18 [Clostridia bacterium]|nr:30S ribosomal protein S18 [Clostridia bacterium]
MEEKTTVTPAPIEGKKPFKKVQRRKVCNFCLEKATAIDYKDIGKLRKYVTEKGKILPRRATGTCAKHQRAVTEAVKRARNIALLPYTTQY